VFDLGLILPAEIGRFCPAEVGLFVIFLKFLLLLGVLLIDEYEDFKLVGDDFLIGDDFVITGE
jgi:hypothetical protein